MNVLRAIFLAFALPMALLWEIVKEWFSRARDFGSGLLVCVGYGLEGSRSVVRGLLFLLCVMAALRASSALTNVVVLNWPWATNGPAEEYAICGSQEIRYTVLNLPVEPERYAEGNTNRNKFNVPGGGYHFLGFSTNGEFRYTNVAGRIDYIWDIDCPGNDYGPDRVNCVTNRIEQWIYSLEAMRFEVSIFRGEPHCWDTAHYRTVWDQFPDYIGDGWWKLTNGPIRIRLEQML
jgi:hypothetical protein